MNPETLEVVPNTFPSLFWGYAVLWLMICIYLFVIDRKISRALDSSPNSVDTND